MLHAAEFVGFENYARLFGDDPLFGKSLANTAYMMLGVPLGMAVGLAIAMLLNTEVRGMRVYRTLFYLPAIVPMVASAILWIWVLNPEVGLVNSLLRMLGVGDPPNWLQSASWGFGSKSAIILMGLWSAGSGMIIWLKRASRAFPSTSTKRLKSTVPDRGDAFSTSPYPCYRPTYFST